jgi:hypothetical protein
MTITKELIQFTVFVCELVSAIFLAKGFVAIWTSKPFLKLRTVIEQQEKSLDDQRKRLEYASKRDQACSDIIYRLVSQLREAKADNVGQFDIFSEIDEQIARREKFEKSGRPARWVLPVEKAENEKGSERG